MSAVAKAKWAKQENDLIGEFDSSYNE